MSVYVWFYRSRETRRMAEVDLAEILEVSRAHNASCGITGMLVYYSGRFTQVIEGGEWDIRSLKRRICEDERHTDIITIYEGREPSRIFAQWSMAFHDPDTQQMQQLESILPLEWARRTLLSIDTQPAARAAFEQMAGWISNGG